MDNKKNLFFCWHKNCSEPGNLGLTKKSGGGILCLMPRQAHDKKLPPHEALPSVSCRATVVSSRGLFYALGKTSMESRTP